MHLMVYELICSYGLSVVESTHRQGMLARRAIEANVDWGYLQRSPNTHGARDIAEGKEKYPCARHCQMTLP